MVNKKAGIFKIIKWSIFILILIAVLFVGFLAGSFFMGKFGKTNSGVVLENPMKGIIIKNTDSSGKVDSTIVVEQGVLNFNENYISYILIAMGVGSLHKSYVGYGNPVVEFRMGDEIWSSEVSGGLSTKKGGNDNKDLIIYSSRQEAVKALLSSDIKQFMKDSVASGDIKIEMIAGKPELLSKGYLQMYKELTGKEAEIE